MLESTANSDRPSRPDILLVGHVTQDLETGDLDGPYRIGGTVSFASVVATDLGRRPVIITRAAAATDLSELPPQAELHVLPSPVTTTFANVYTPEGRIQYCYAQALPISVDDIPHELRAPRTVLLGPLVDEIEPGVAAVFDDRHGGRGRTAGLDARHGTKPAASTARNGRAARRFCPISMS